MYKKLFTFFYIAILAVALPSFAWAYVGSDGMDKHTSGVQIGGLDDDTPTTQETRFLLLSSALSQCVDVGNQTVNFKLNEEFFTKFQIDHYDIAYSCVNRQDFFGSDSGEDILLENVLTSPTSIIGNYKTDKIIWNIPSALSGKICKLWLTPMPFHEGRHIYTRPFQICGKSGSAPDAGNVQINFISWETDESGRGTWFNYLVSGLANRQSVDFVFDIYSKDTSLTNQSVGIISARGNGASRVLASGLWLTMESNALIIPRVISINTASTDIEESEPPAPPKTVNFSNLTCKTQTDGSISVSGKLSSIVNPPLSSWVVRYDGTLKGQSANQILQNKNTKTAGLKSNIKTLATIATKLTGLNGQYCFGLNAQDKNKKYYPYFPSAPVCCSTKSAPSKPVDPIKIYDTFIAGYKTQYAVIDPRGFKINLKLVKNRIFADIVGSDSGASGQASLIDAAGAKVAMSGPYYYQNGGWRQWSINSTFVQNGKILRLLNIGSHICQKANGDILYGRFRALIKATTTNGKNSQSFVISNVNSMPPNGNSIVAFTKEAFPNGGGWRSSIPNDYAFKAAIVNNGKISFVSNDSFSPSGDYDYILVFYGTERNRFEKSAYPNNFLAQGQNVSFSYQSIPGSDVNMAQWQDCQTIIGLNHTVMYRGKTIINPASSNSAKIQAQGNFDNSLVEDRDTLSNEASLRSMVGIGADNKIYFITVAEGLRLFDEYKVAQALKLQYVANMDGGCSAFLYGSGKFYSNPCRATVPSILYAK